MYKERLNLHVCICVDGYKPIVCVPMSVCEFTLYVNVYLYLIISANQIQMLLR